MNDSPAEGRSDGFDHDLRALLDDQRRREAVEGRRRERWLEQEAGEAGTLAGILLDLGEREELVTVATTAGRLLSGAVRTLGADFLGLRSPTGQGTLVAFGAITSIRPEPGTATSVGDRLVSVDAELRDVLATLAVERPWVSLHTRSGDGLAGHLRSVGRDVVTLAQRSGTAVGHVPLLAVGDVVLP